MNKPLIAANWKLNKTISETRSFIVKIIPLVKEIWDTRDIVIAPPFTSLQAAHLALKDTNIKLSAQNVFFHDNGAFTGEVSPPMLIDSGCTHVIIGHSERRQYFYETNEIVNKKINAAKKHNLIVIFCIGESLAEREEGKTFNVLKNQLAEGLKDITAEGIVIAYEPIWAIGTGKTATPQQAQEVHKFIRDWLLTKYGEEGYRIRIIYGGSVTPENIDSLMDCMDIEGALVGGASLDAERFARIANFKRRDY